jgi:predicted N-acyltransferase
LRRAVDQFLAHEREAVAEHIEELATQGPFRRAEGREEDDI